MLLLLGATAGSSLAVLVHNGQMGTFIACAKPITNPLCLPISRHGQSLLSTEVPDTDSASSPPGGSEASQHAGMHSRPVRRSGMAQDKRPLYLQRAGVAAPAWAAGSVVMQGHPHPDSKRHCCPLRQHPDVQHLPPDLPWSGQAAAQTPGEPCALAPLLVCNRQWLNAYGLHVRHQTCPMSADGASGRLQAARCILKLKGQLQVPLQAAPYA